MPDENVNGNDMTNALESLEEYSWTDDPGRIEHYQVIQAALERGGRTDVITLERILTVCVYDLKQDMKYTFVVMNLIPIILQKVQTGRYNPPPDLVPAALGVMSIIKTTALMNKVETLKLVCYDTLISFPDDTLILIAETEHFEVLTLLNLYFQMRIPIDIRLQAFSFLYKLLTILMGESRKTFIQHDLSVWFSKVIPTIMTHMSQNPSDCKMLVDILEMLSEVLLGLEYQNNKYWVDEILKSICQQDKYPAVMKVMLQAQSDVWHRVWIVFIKLLKSQITQSFPNIGTPINSMLPVVEAAFKVDVTNRCRAFECWNVLTKSLSADNVEGNISKRIKLLLIPLKSNNARVEETALAKFKCWWNVIIKFGTDMDRFLDMIVISFLHFLFGRHNAVDKTAVVPGQLTLNVKRQTIQAIVELIGHVRCYGCTDLPSFGEKIISPKHLVEHWNQWVFSLTSAIMIASKDDLVLTDQQVKCLWKAFIFKIGELPDNNIRRDLFNEMLSIVKHLIQESKDNRKLADIAFDILLMSLFDGDPKIKKLLKAKNGENSPINEALNMLQEPSLKQIYQGLTTRELVTKLKHITNLAVDKQLNSIPVLERFASELPANDTSLTVWTAVAESMYEYERLPIRIMVSMLMWPLKCVKEFTDISQVKLAAIIWYRLYKRVQPKEYIEKDMMELMLTPKEFTKPVSYFTLCAMIAVIKNKVVEKRNFIKYFKEFNKQAELFETLTTNIGLDCYTNGEEIFPALLDILVFIFQNVTAQVNQVLASQALVCFKNTLQIATKELNEGCDDKIKFLANVLKLVDDLFNTKSYARLGSLVADNLTQFLSALREHASNNTETIQLVEAITRKIKNVNQENEAGIVSTEIFEVIDTTEIQEKENESQNNKFPTPNTKEVPKKSKKKEPSIVNTISENGEEYVVVKSNWKFNPRKLTENQKERLKRKREDIPALYQDLSQSQDEFQLQTWRTESQDASSSTSETRSNASAHENATTILKNLPSSDVVPTIMDNILTKEKNSKVTDLPKNTQNQPDPTTPNTTKSHRIALKDRVFRNVRNLIEKSSFQNENKEAADQNKSERIVKMPTPADVSSENNKTENLPKTPTTSKPKTTDIIHSAPPLISTDRPSRVKRKPKKFDDLELLALKKSRISLNLVQAESTELQAQTIEPTTDNRVHKNKEEVTDTKNELNNSINNDNHAKGANLDIDHCVSQESEGFSEAHEEVNYINKQGTETTRSDQNKIEVVTEKSQEDNIVDVEKTTKEIVVTVCDGKSLNMGKNDENISKKVDDNSVKDDQVSTPKQFKVKELEQKSSAKKNCVKKSRIEKELAIDMVEGNPFLNIPSEKRLTRKSAATPPAPHSARRKGVAEKLKSKPDNNTLAKNEKKNKDKKEIENVETSFTVNETQDKADLSKDSTSEDVHCSEDVIESSQDSTFSTLSVKSAKKSVPKIPLVSIEKLKHTMFNDQSIVSQSILDCGPNEATSTKANSDSKDDIELPLNKTVVQEKSCADLTENMDTEPINDNDISDDVIIIDDEIPAPMTISSDETVVGPETQELAEADTQPTDPSDFMDTKETPHDKITESIIIPNVTEKESNIEVGVENVSVDKDVEKSENTQNDITTTLSESVCAGLRKTTDVSSPFKDDAQRKQDFLNNTLEISPIKTMSPDKDKTSPSPETSSDYVVIRLTSPVQSNGEPFEKCASPEFFTDDKVSPDKRDQSPPRVEITVTNTSPSTSLSLRKNRPQVRPGGRAAQMLGLCVPVKLNTIINSERNELEESKKSSPSNTAARRNLRILYNSVQNENSENISENEDSESFLKFKRSIPPVDSSPSGPILKRKFIEIIDDVIISPASKRKRVSFHDPPVSTTISVQKYIEPGGLRSPQNSAQKRLERQMRQFVPIKSPKRLDNAFKLDSALTKTLESFTVVDVNNITDDTQTSSLDETPSVEIVKPSELNDTDPICPDLLDCKDAIDNIATELSSPAMKSLLIKELESQVQTVGDLAKLTELEVNRLCIKAPKVQVAKKVLADYATKKAKNPDATVTIDEAMFDETMNEAPLVARDVEIQTDGKNHSDMEIQTTSVQVKDVSLETEVVQTSHLSVQTDETGEGSTADVVKSCLLKRPDFVEQLCEQLQETSVRHMSDKLPFNALTELFMKKVSPSNTNDVLKQLLDQHSGDVPVEQRKNSELSFLQHFMFNRFETKDLIMFCSLLLKRVHDEPE